MNALSNIGGGLGIVCVSVLAGTLIDTGTDWICVHYIVGTVELMFFVIFFIFGDDAPEGTNFPLFNKIRPFRFSALISEEEKTEIINSRVTKKREGKLNVPWSLVCNLSSTT